LWAFRDGEWNDPHPTRIFGNSKDERKDQIMETKGEKIENFRHSQQILWRMALENLNGFKWK